MHRWLARNVFYPAQEALQGRDSVDYWRTLEQSQWLEPDQHRALQQHKLYEILEYARTHVPFYRERFAAARFQPILGEARAQLQELPTLSKEDIRSHREEMIATPLQHQVKTSCTSGSTGSPLIFGVGNRRCRADVAARLRAHRWFGIRPGDRAIYLWGATVENSSQDWLKAFRDWLINERLLNAFRLDEANLRRYVEIVRRVRPDSLYSYASTLWRFAQFVNTRHPELRGAIATVAFATGEQMLPHWRAEIIRNLDCMVAEEYGCREGGLIAHECPAGAYHITTENIVLEVLDDDGRVTIDGEGELVVTNLEAFAMPFIRYRTGDRGQLRAGSCPCGRSLPMMWRPTGRSFEFLETDDGTRISGVSISRDLKEVEGIAHYRVVQLSRSEVQLLVVTNDRYDAATAEPRITTLVRARIGVRTAVEICYVDRLPSHASGKYRYVVNAMDATRRPATPTTAE